MNPKLAAKFMAELTEDVKHMDEDAQTSFAALLPMLSKLYRRDSTVKGVLIFCDADSQTLIRINADEYEANGMLHTAMPLHEELLKANAPDQGRLN
jgi:hypothetical protein